MKLKEVESYVFFNIARLFNEKQIVMNKLVTNTPIACQFETIYAKLISVICGRYFFGKQPLKKQYPSVFETELPCWKPNYYL